MPDLTDFVLARIAEDEARWARAESPWSAPHDPDCQYPGDMPGYCTCDLLDRLKARCKADRLIVALYRGQTGANYSQRRGEHETAKAALLALASVYADHPEFREEWR